MSRTMLFLAVVLGVVLLAARAPEALANPDRLVGLIAMLGFLALFVFGWGRNQRSRGETGASALPLAAIWLGIFGALALGYTLFTENRSARRAAEFAAVSGGTSPETGAAQLELIRGRDGHFHVEARINGAPIRMMVDTGATTIAIPYEMAEGLGISTNRLAYIIDIRTANGVAKAAPVPLDSLTLGPIVMRNLRATVSQPGALQTPLLGQSVLNRLQGYVVQGDRMILTGR